MNKYNILYYNQHGFCENPDTRDFIINFVGIVSNSFDNKRKSIEMFLDLAKAFDTLNHDICVINWNV